MFGRSTPHAFLEVSLQNASPFFLAENASSFLLSRKYYLFFSKAETVCCVLQNTEESSLISRVYRQCLCVLVRCLQIIPGVKLRSQPGGERFFSYCQQELGDMHAKSKLEGTGVML